MTLDQVIDNLRERIEALEKQVKDLREDVDDLIYEDD